MRVLLVEDNRELIGLLTKALERAGLEVDWARTVGDAEASLRAMSYAAVVLDLGLPDADGLGLLDHMRRRRDATPVLILTARSGIEDRVKGLDKGASDYLTKPFASEELIARLQSLLRRAPPAEGHVLKVGNVAFETAGRQASVAGRPVAVPAREADLLEVLMKRNGRLVSQEVLRGQVFGATQAVSSNTVEVYVHRLRRLLADAGATVQIHTIRGAGYLMKADPVDAA